MPIDRTLAEVMPDAIIFLNKAGKITWWNPAAERLFGLLPDQHLQAHIRQILDHPNLSEDLSLQNKNRMEVELPSQPNKNISFMIVSYSQNDFILLAQDITHIHLLERIRQDFVANVSHELRTPLTVIHGYLESLMDQECEKTKQLHPIFKQMYDQSVRMEKLVEDLLLLSRLESTEQETKSHHPVNVPALLKTICDEAKTLSRESNHHIHLTIQQPVCLEGIEDELRSMFSNIIFNAVKYTPAKGHIYIDWYVENDRAFLKVRDTGIGIAQEHIPRLTERFYRVDKARSRASGGTGLGLAIVKHVLMRHQGKLEISSQLGSGSTFICIFPQSRLIGTINK